MNLIALTPEQEAKTQADLQLLIQSGRKFSVILADPPWPYETWSAKGKDRSAEKHYATSGIGKICSFPIQQLAAPDCVLLLWVTPSRVHTATQVVLPSWHFEFKTTGFVWIKQNRKSPGLFLGMGKWTRLGSEICLLATRGKPKRQAADVRQVLIAPVGRHSAKPAEVQDRIERLLPGPYLELFARRQRPGWVCWGAEAS